MKKKLFPRAAEVGFILATLLCSLGIRLSANSGFGVSMVAAPAFVLFKYLSQTIPWFTQGMAEYLIQGILVLSCVIIMKKFRFRYLLAFASAILTGLCLDGWGLLLGTQVYGAMWQRILSAVAGMIICAIAIALYLRSYLPQQAYELLVKELTTKTGKSVTLIKWLYDIGSLLISIIMMLLFFHRFNFELIGLYTLIVTAVNSPLIALCGKLLELFMGFDPAFPAFRKKYDKLMD